VNVLWGFIGLDGGGKIDQRRVDVLLTRSKSAYQGFLSVRPSVRHITDTKNPCVLVLTRCHVTDINHVLTPCHVTEINYVDRGAAARAPLQLKELYLPYFTGKIWG
jgi:hypothetical protein